MFENFYFYISFIYANLENNYLIYLFIYFFSLVIFFSFSLPGGPIFLIVSGFFFGFTLGFFINIISILIGSYVFVFFFKNIYKKIFNRFYYNFSNKINSYLKHSSYEYLILIRLVTGTPLFIQNLFLAFINVSKIKFLITSFFGFIPIIIVCTYFGSKLHNFYEIENIKYTEIISKDFIILLMMIICLLIIRIIFKKKLKNHK